MPVPQPDAASRWRCTLCGNLTRFDVTRTTRAQEYVHVDLAGQQVVEDREVLGDTVEHVVCRWCKAVDAVEVVARPGLVGPPPNVPRAGTSDPAAGATSPEDAVLIDCDGCAVRDLACDDCVVTVLLGAPPGPMEVDEGERRALDALADSGLVPRLQLVPLGLPGQEGRQRSAAS